MRSATTAALLAVVGSYAMAQIDDPLEILRHNIQANSSVDYSGVRTVVLFEGQRKINGVQQRVQYQAPDKLRITVIAPPAQRGKLWLTNGQEQWECDPTIGRAVRAQLPPPDAVQAQRMRELERLAATMRLQYCGVDSVVGRRAHVVKVYTQQGVPLRKSWIDAATWVALKTQRFDPQGQVRSSVFFTRISFDPVFPPGLFDYDPPEGCTVIDAASLPKQMSLDQAEQAAGFQAVMPGYLPRGYHFVANGVAVITVNGRTALWLPFSNGVDTMSIFQRQSEGPPDTLRRGRSVTWQAGGFRFTLLGPLSADEMQRVKDSINP